MPRIAVIGANGQLGSRLCEAAGLKAIPVTRNDVSLEDEAGLARFIKALDADIVINAAAYTNVEKAEEERRIAFAINAKAPEIMALACKERGIKFVHLSTDYVFDGEKNAPYNESDVTHPLNVYGESKRTGESAVLRANPEALIVRVSWLYDSRKKNFFTTIAKKLEETALLNIVDDQRGTPCYAPDIAQALVMLCRAGLPSGVLHMANSGDTTWCGFANAIRAGLEAKGRTPLALIKPVTSDQYPSKVKRPADSRLDTAQYQRHTGENLPHWQDAARRAIEEYHAD